jgi:hypothetical protein
MPQPSISVIISTANRRPLLERTISALLCQRLPADLAFEVIVVDNHSRDDTRQTIEELIRSGRAPQLRYAFEPRRGVSYGRNTGIRLARAPMVAFTDDDIEVGDDWLATIHATFEEFPDADAIGGPIDPVWPGPAPSWLSEWLWSPLAILDYGRTPFFTSQQNPRCLLTANFAVRRDVFARVGGFSPDFPRCQDHEWQIRFWRAGHRALYAPSLRVRTRVPPERMTRAYHRQWHRRHGEFAAAMRLQEIVGPAGQLLATPAPSALPFGVPGYVCRELVQELARSLLGRPMLDAPAAFHHDNRVRYLTAYMAHRVGQRRTNAIQVDWPVARAESPEPVSPDRQNASVPLSPGRLLTVYALIATLLGGSAWDLLNDREHWPFSPYAMFAHVDRDTRLTALRPIGVTADDPPRLLPLLDYAMIAPFDQCRLSTAFARVYHDPLRRTQLAPMLADILERYEERRHAGRHDGPKLRAVRLYEVTWPIEIGHARETPQLARVVAEHQPEPEGLSR